MLGSVYFHVPKVSTAFWAACTGIWQCFWGKLTSGKGRKRVNPFNGKQDKDLFAQERGNVAGGGGIYFE